LSDVSEFLPREAEQHGDIGQDRQITKALIFENSRWRTAAILQIVKSAYLNYKSSDFDETWCTMQI